MTAKRTYLDWNATAPLRPEARATMVGAGDLLGNPSSVHAEGRAARRVLDLARDQVAALAGCNPRDVIFTSGGSEANALALTPAIVTGRNSAYRERLFVSAIEHPSVLSGGRFAPEKVETLAVLPNGQLDLSDLAVRLEGHSRPLVSIMAANNETGVIQPIAEAAERVHEAGGLLHVDAVQVPGRIPLAPIAACADLLTLSAHKLGGPKGVGALLKISTSLHFAEPLIRGGGQEGGARAGTENIAGIAGFGAAAGAALQNLADERQYLLALREHIQRGLRLASPDAVIFGEAAERLPNTVLFGLSGMAAETALIGLDLDGIAVSSGSACSSGKVARSHVLDAMGVEPALARSAIRVSFGFSTTKDDIETFLAAWKTRVESLPKQRQEIAA